jgi:hypothetical protein
MLRLCSIDIAEKKAKQNEQLFTLSIGPLSAAFGLAA